MNGHWIYKDGQIHAYVKVEDTYTPIAFVMYGERRPVQQMLRYAHLGEELERLGDQVLFRSTYTEDSPQFTQQELVDKILTMCHQMIEDTSGKDIVYPDGKGKEEDA